LELRMGGPDRAGAGPKRRAGTRPAPTSLGDVVGIFKSISTHKYAMNVNTNYWPPFAGKLWQRNYYEHIIRNEDELKRIRDYIKNNPLQWVNDRNNPINYNEVK
jgi:putative transposase